MGGSLTKSLSNLTEHFRLGFGSFADKPIMPFINPGSEQNPCDLVHDKCLPTYGFKHKLGLTDDIQQFVAKVNSSEITANLDNLEGLRLICNPRTLNAFIFIRWPRRSHADSSVSR